MKCKSEMTLVKIKIQILSQPDISTHATTFTLTSPSFGGSTVIVSAARGIFGPRATMALHVIGLPSVAMVKICFVRRCLPLVARGF